MTHYIISVFCPKFGSNFDATTAGMLLVFFRFCMHCVPFISLPYQVG